MIKWLVAGAALLIAVIYLLFAIGDSSPTPPSTGDQTPTSVASDSNPLPGRRSAPVGLPQSPDYEAVDTPDEDPADKTERDPLYGTTLDTRLDVEYPARYYANIATRCDPTGFDPDATVHLQYQLRILRGEVLATNVRVIESTVGDAAFEQCLVAAIEQARWRDDDMPDLDEEHDFYYRVKAQKKHLPEDEQKDFGKMPDADDSAEKAKGPREAGLSSRYTQEPEGAATAPDWSANS